MTTTRAAAAVFGAGLLGVVAGAAIVGAAPKAKGAAKGVVEAREIRLVDSKGVERGSWVSSDDGCILTLFADGKARVTLKCTADGSAFVNVGDGTPGQVTTFVDSSGTSGVGVKRRGARVSVGIDADGDPGVGIQDKDENLLFLSPKK